MGERAARVGWRLVLDRWMREGLPQDELVMMLRDPFWFGLGRTHQDYLAEYLVHRPELLGCTILNMHSLPRWTMLVLQDVTALLAWCEQHWVDQGVCETIAQAHAMMLLVG